MELSKLNDTKVKYDGQRACFLFEVISNMVTGDDSVKKGTHLQLSLIEESYIKKESEKQLRS